MKTSAWHALLTGIALALVSGCSTPESRISKNQEIFNRFPPETQEKVRAGKIEPGFTRDMVYLALGEPDRKYTRKTASGQSDIWSYVSRYTTTDRRLVTVRFRVHTPDRGYRTVRDSVWVDVDQMHEYDRLRLEFDGDTLKAIEEVQR